MLLDGSTSHSHHEKWMTQRIKSCPQPNSASRNLVLSPRDPSGFPVTCMVIVAVDSDLTAPLNGGPGSLFTLTSGTAPFCTIHALRGQFLRYGRKEESVAFLGWDAEQGVPMAYVFHIILLHDNIYISDGVLARFSKPTPSRLGPCFALVAR